MTTKNKTTAKTLSDSFNWFFVAAASFTGNSGCDAKIEG
jgi:hypothetical protein